MFTEDFSLNKDGLNSLKPELLQNIFPDLGTTTSEFLPLITDVGNQIDLKQVWILISQ